MVGLVLGPTYRKKGAEGHKSRSRTFEGDFTLLDTETELRKVTMDSQPVTKASVSSKSMAIVTAVFHVSGMLFSVKVL